MTASQKSRHLTITDLKLTVALHNIPFDGRFVENRPFRTTSPVMTLCSESMNGVRIQAGHSYDKLLKNNCFFNADALLNIFTGEIIQGDC